MKSQTVSENNNTETKNTGISRFIKNYPAKTDTPH
jgi:hypothetical protein